MDIGRLVWFLLFIVMGGLVRCDRINCSTCSLKHQHTCERHPILADWRTGRLSSITTYRAIPRKCQPHSRYVEVHYPERNMCPVTWQYLIFEKRQEENVNAHYSISFDFYDGPLHQSACWFTRCLKFHCACFIYRSLDIKQSSKWKTWLVHASHARCFFINMSDYVWSGFPIH